MSISGFFSSLYDAMTEHENENQDINNKNTDNKNITEKETEPVQENKDKINDKENENKTQSKPQELVRGADFVKENVYGEKDTCIEPDVINNKCDVCGIKASDDNTLGEFTLPVTYSKWSDNYYKGGFMVYSTDRKVRLCSDCVGKLLRSSGRLIETHISNKDNKSEYGLVISEVKPPWESDSDFQS